MLTFVPLIGLLLIPADSATIKWLARVHRKAPAQQQSSLEMCPAGSRISDTGDCISCIYGVDFTSHLNALPSCLRCSVCGSDEEETQPCTPTRDRECQCKAGTFRERDAPEFCQKCSTGCPHGMVQDSPCSPWSDLKCVSKETRTKVTQEGIQ